MRIWLSLLLIAVSVDAFGQALISNRIEGYSVTEPPGLVYFDDTIYSESFYFQIGFRIDADKFSSEQRSNCDLWTPEGYWLYDRHPNGADGRWMITLGGDGQICFKDMPAYSWGHESWNLQFPTRLDTCHMLTAERKADGTLTVTLDDDSQTVRESADNGPSWRGGPNGIGVGREVNGFHARDGVDSFPGEIYYLNDNGHVLAFDGSSRVTGNASLGTSACADRIPKSPPPTVCETDPGGIECVCETNPHPACNVCLAR